MQFRIKRIKTMVKKEIIDHTKNTSIFVLSVIPLLCALMYRNMDIPGDKLHVSLTFILSVTVAMLTTSIMAILIAEEKEKHTLRTLMMTGLSSMEFLAGKALVTFVYTNILSIVAFILLKAPMQYLLGYILIGVILSIIMLIIGAIVGLFAQSQTQVGIISSPITLSFVMIPLLGLIGIHVGWVSILFPTHHTGQLLQRITQDESILSDPMNIIVLAGWVALALIVFIRVYRMKRFD